MLVTTLNYWRFLWNIVKLLWHFLCKKCITGITSSQQFVNYWREWIMLLKLPVCTICFEVGGVAKIQSKKLRNPCQIFVYHHPPPPPPPPSKKYDGKWNVGGVNPKIAHLENFFLDKNLRIEIDVIFST